MGIYSGKSHQRKLKPANFGEWFSKSQVTPTHVPLTRREILFFNSLWRHMVTYIWFDIGSGNGLFLPSEIKPLSGLKLPYHQRHSVAFDWGNWNKKMLTVTYCPIQQWIFCQQYWWPGALSMVRTSVAILHNTHQSISAVLGFSQH